MTEKKRPPSREELEKLQRAADWTIENWHTLGVIDHAQHGPLLPASLRIRDGKTGGLKETPCVLMLLDGPRVVQARRRARQWAVDIGIEDNRDTGQDKDLVREFESFEELAYAVRDPEDPHDQMYPDGRALFAALRNRGTAHELYAIFDQWTTINNPGYGELDAEGMWRVLSAVARAGNLVPLMHIDGRAQAASILLSVREALKSPNAPPGFALRPTSISPPEAPAI
jgi:hypothetical protein